jgi:hypothetical protein
VPVLNSAMVLHWQGPSPITLILYQLKTIIADRIQATGLSQQNNNSLQKLEVAPNPFTDDAFVNASTFLDKGSYLNIYDSQGKFVKHYLVTEKTKKIAIKNLSQGLYHCILYDKNGKRIGFAHFIVFK